MIFRWEAVPDPAWQEALDRLAPRTERGPAWLNLVWHPGDPWAPVQRWVIYQMHQRIPPIVLDDLLGPNPRNYGFWDTTRKEFVRLRQSTVDRMQWKLFQETGCYAKPYWVVQGSHGGHKRRWDDFEAGVSIAQGGPESPPPMGDLRYAEPDNRTWERIRAHDMVLQWRQRTEFVDRSDAQQNAERAEAQKQMRATVWNIMTEEVEAGLEFTNDQLDVIRDAWRHNAPPPRTERDRRPYDADEVRESFINAA